MRTALDISRAKNSAPLCELLSVRGHTHQAVRQGYRLNQATTVLTLTAGINRYPCARNGHFALWCARTDCSRLRRSASALLRPAAALRASPSNLSADGQVVEPTCLSVGGSNLWRLIQPTPIGDIQIARQNWCARTDSNRRPPGSKPGALSS